jgi:16S rRNA (cytidine1402-2'-O)-methyltransferase
MKPALYLIPVTLGDTPPKDVLPETVFRTIAMLDEFIVENVRSARRFLRKAGYQKDFAEVTFHEMGKHSDLNELLAGITAQLKTKPVGLLSEAGTPCIADPGSLIVKYCHQLKIPVVPLVGPSSILLALMASGFNGQNFAFHGYLPIEKPKLRQKIKQMEAAVFNDDQTQIFIETPYRNNRLLEALLSGASQQLMLCIATELTTGKEKITTRSIGDWKSNTPDLNKQPAVFLLYK